MDLDATQEAIRMVSEGEVKMYRKDECPLCGDSVGLCVYCARGRRVIANRRLVFTEREEVPIVPTAEVHPSAPRF